MILQHIHNFIQSALAFIVALVGVSLIHVHLWVSIVVLLVTGGYAARKWYLMEKELKDASKQNKNNGKESSRDFHDNGISDDH